MGDFGQGAIAHMKRMKIATLWAAKQQAGLAEGEMRTKFPWTPRTHTAHRALHAGAEISGDKVVMYLAHGVKYGNYLEEGTPPHKIKAKNKPFLKFRVGGRFVTAKEVNHPGTKPRAIVLPTAKKYKVSLRDAVLKVWGAE